MITPTDEEADFETELLLALDRITDSVDTIRRILVGLAAIVVIAIAVGVVALVVAL